MYLKTSFFVLFISLLLFHSSASFQIEQLFNIINDTKTLKVIKIDINKAQEWGANTLELIIEYSASIRSFTFYISPANRRCNREGFNPKYYLIRNGEIVREGIKQIHIKENFINDFRKGIYICKKILNIDPIVMTINPLFNSKIYFEPLGALQNGVNAELSKFHFHLTSEVEIQSYINICIKFKSEGNFLVKIYSNYTYKIAFQYIVKILHENEEKCNSKMLENESSLQRQNTLIYMKEQINIYIYNTFLEENENLIFGEIKYNSPHTGGPIPKLEPLFDDGSYQFEFNDKGVITKEIKINNDSNNIITRIFQRELFPINKNVILPFKVWQQWFDYDKKYFVVDKNGKAKEFKENDLNKDLSVFIEFIDAFNSN
ncbi:hypothetical protein ACQ4LE_002946 [Meloidogyne hapla]